MSLEENATKTKKNIYFFKKIVNPLQYCNFPQEAIGNSRTGHLKYET